MLLEEAQAAALEGLRALAVRPPLHGIPHGRHFVSVRCLCVGVYPSLSLPFSLFLSLSLSLSVCLSSYSGTEYIVSVRN